MLSQAFIVLTLAGLVATLWVIAQTPHAAVAGGRFPRPLVAVGAGWLIWCLLFVAVLAMTPDFGPWERALPFWVRGLTP